LMRGVLVMRLLQGELVRATHTAKNSSGPAVMARLETIRRARLRERLVAERGAVGAGGEGKARRGGRGIGESSDGDARGKGGKEDEMEDGVLWEEVGRKRPSTGREIFSPILAGALEAKLWVSDEQLKLAGLNRQSLPQV